MNNGTPGALRSVEVAGVRFEFYRIGPRELIALLWRIIGLLGMSLKADGKADLGKLAVGDIIANLFERCDEKTLYEVTDRLLVNTIMLTGKEGSKGGYLRDKNAWEVAFGGEGGTMRFFKVTGEAMEVYYGDFFADVVALFGMDKNALLTTIKTAATEAMKLGSQNGISGGSSSQG